MDVPDAVRAAAAAKGAPAESDIDGPIGRGDLRRVQPPGTTSGEPRICLVTRVESTAEFAEVLLAHAFVEWATQHDLVVQPGDEFTPYPLVLQTDVRGVVWLTQVGRRVGVVDDGLLIRLGQVAAGEDLDAPDVGMRLSGVVDPRWAFKIAEGEAMAALAADCTDALLDGGSPWQLDPGLLSVDLLMGAPDFEALVIDLMDVLETRSVELDLDDLDMLDRLGVMSIDRMVEAFGADLGMMFFESIQSLVNDALATAASSAPAVDPDLDQNAWLPGRPDVAAACVPTPRRRRLVTAAHLWEGSVETLRHVVTVDGTTTEEAVEVHLVGVASGGEVQDNAIH